MRLNQKTRPGQPKTSRGPQRASQAVQRKYEGYDLRYLNLGWPCTMTLRRGPEVRTWVFYVGGITKEGRLRIARDGPEGRIA